MGVILVLAAALQGMSDPEPRGELDQLARQFGQALKCYVAYDYTGDCGRLLRETREPERIARFMNLLHEDQGSDSRFIEPLVMVIKQTSTWGPNQPLMATIGDRARRMLITYHIRDKSIGLALAGLASLQPCSETAEAILREAFARNPHREVQARACYWLGRYLKCQAECIPVLMDAGGQADFRAKCEAMWGRQAVVKLQSKSPAKLFDEAEELFARVLERYGDVTAYGREKDDNLLRDLASLELHELRDLVPGRPSPDIAGKDSEGKPLSLHDHLGKVVLLTFSANWCGPCRAMYPHERELIRRHKDKPFVILSVNADTHLETLNESIRKGEITWRCWWDRPPRPICKQWNIAGYPTTYLIDHTGTIRYKNINERDLDDAVNRLLAEAMSRTK